MTQPVRGDDSRGAQRAYPLNASKRVHMSEYFYLVASLPSITFGQKPDISKDEFIAECEKWLTPGDMKMVLSADLSREDPAGENSGCLAAWKQFDAGLRGKLALLRRARKRGEEHKTTGILKEVMNEKNPLLKETALEKVRWDFIEHQGVGSYFDVNRVVLYFLQLQISERLSSFDKETGEGIFYKLCEVDHGETKG